MNLKNLQTMLTSCILDVYHAFMYVKETPKKTTVMSRFNTFVLTALILASATLIGIHAEPSKAPMASGMYVNDPGAVIPSGAYLAFSTMHDGKRYYLGVDTTRAKAGVDTLAWFDAPNYATMWIVGGMYNPKATKATDVLPDQNYLRTLKNVWIKEKCSRNRYLALGADRGSYSEITLRDTAQATFWYTEKDSREASKYIQGFLYYHSDVGSEVYRYLTYNPLYGFSRAYSAKPSAAQRITVWDRKTGSDLVFDVHPKTFTIGWETNGRTSTAYPISSQVIFYENVDRFRSRYDQVDVYAARSAAITNQSTLVAEPYNLFGYYEWKSNQTVDPNNVNAYDGKSKMQVYKPIVDTHGSADEEEWTYDMGWADTTMLYVRENGYTRVGDIWYDTIYAVGSAPIDRPAARFLRKPAGGGAPTEGNWVNHNDVLYIKFTCKGQQYVDSMSVSRHTFHEKYYTKMDMSHTPNDHTFPYTYDNKLADGATPMQPEDVAHTFTISATYKAGSTTYNAVNAAVQIYTGEERALDIASMNCISDTIWEYDEYGELVDDGEGNPKYSVILYDTLQVQAFEADGVTPCAWIESVTLSAKNQIRVQVKQSSPSVPANRVAQIRYTYRYWHSGAEGDQVSSTHTIWIVQEWSGAHDDELYTFNHKNAGPNGLQEVHEKIVKMYALPEKGITLPLHRDLWGYYRWFTYDGASKDRDVENDGSWKYTDEPKNNNGGIFMPINISTSVTSRGRWDMAYGDPKHFVLNTATLSPSVKNVNTAKNSIRVACDVSEYTDVAYEGELGVSLASVTEPTLSYRNVFDIQPAVSQADTMAKYRYLGDGADANPKWMETHVVVAPAGRALTLSPQYPIAANVSTSTEPSYNEDELQYIYWFNANKTDNADPNMGLKGSLDESKATSYNRIGVTRHTQEDRYTARLMSQSEISGMTSGTQNVIMVNPHKEAGYVLGKGNPFAPLPLPDSVTNTTKLQHFIEDAILNTSDNMEAYKLVMEGSSEGIHINKDGQRITYSGQSYLIAGGDFKLSWENSIDEGYDSWTMKVVTPAENSNYYLTSAKSYAVHLEMSAKVFAAFNRQKTGYITGSDTRRECLRYKVWSCQAYDTIYTSNLKISEALGSYDDYANQAWLFFKIEAPRGAEHYETPRWEKYDGTEWREVARWNYSTNKSVATMPGYSMRPDGSLEIPKTMHTTPNETIQYRLRTEHFQLMYMPLILRNPNEEGPKEGSPIITEEDIEANYTVLFDLGKEDWPAPGTGDVQAYNHHLPWDFTELSYHYPKTVIGNEYRDSVTDMPLKGEYAFLNKFIVPTGGKNTGNEGDEFEARAGAANGYMLVVNADSKRTTIMRFDYPSLSCSNQQIYLVADYCNPVDNPFEPQITADLEGSNDGVHWTGIYRFKTGKIPYNKTSPWYQSALPIAREKIQNFKTFRCKAMLDGATNKNAQILIDRLRFIERTRSFSVFQSKAACVKDDSVSVLIRIDYQSDPDLYQPGRLVAYQLQKWDDTVNEGKGGYVPMSASHDNGNGTYTALTNETGLEVYPGYIKDAFTATESVEKPFLKSLAHNDYGYVLIPEHDYDPSLSADPAKQSAKRTALVGQAITKLGLTGDAATARRAFINETNNVRAFEDVVSNDNLSFGSTKTPHIKSFVKEGNEWVIYVVCRLPVGATKNNTFRIGMTVMNDLDDTPTFTEESCATFRVLNIKQTTSFLVNGEPWGNHPRDWYDGSDAEHQLLPANETYRTSIKLTVASTVGSNPTKNPRCKFDLLHASLDVRDTTRNGAGDAAFLAKYGCSRTQFVDDMNAFRSDDERNEMRDITDWSLVTPADFTRTGRPADVANAIYNRLNHLVEEGLLEIGLDYRDIYMGDRADSYFYLLPVPATGLYDVTNGNAAGTADTTLQASVCNDTLWLELHSEEPEYKLRYGYDSRVGDTYIVPVIRATRSEANGLSGKKLNVRIAHITSEDAKATVIGWQQTKLVESSDTTWKAGNDAQAFYYVQDKNVTGTTLNGYYTSGDTVRFAPKAGTTFRLKAGHWYRFKTAFFGTTTPDAVYSVDESEDSHIKGHSSFILAIAPDTVRWNPSHPDNANYWNDDANWMPVVNDADYPEALAKVPMADSRVIIVKASSESQLPIISETVIERKDTLHFGYAKNTCREILFKPQSQILGQEKLNYTKAFVDVVVKTANWQTFSPALKNIYSGDIYVPRFAGSGNDPDFAPATFEGSNDFGENHNRTYPYAFYQAYYNSTVKYAFHNTDDDQLATIDRTSKNSAEWVKTNVLDQELKPGHAVALLGYGPTDVEDSSLIVRLPKQENTYHYIGTKRENYAVSDAVNLSRVPFNAVSGNLEYDKATLQAAGGEGITYSLTNDQASKVFFFGNPTMALIDVYKLCEDNISKLEHTGDNKYKFTTYQMRDGSTYSTEIVDGPGKYFIAPQRAVGLIAQTETTTLDVLLKPGAMVAMTGSGTPVHEAANAPMRRAKSRETETAKEKYLYIAASNETNQGLYKSYLTLGESDDAHRGFVPGEDALSLTSGLSYFDQGAFATPLSMYTIASNQALMYDMRDTVKAVPLVFATLEDKVNAKGRQIYQYSDITMLCFATAGEWDKPLYLYDALSGDSLMIVNGLQVGIQTPQAGQIRYFINGYRAQETGDVATSVETVEENSEFSMPDTKAQAAVLYDMLGHKIATLGEWDMLTSLRLPAGVYIIQRGSDVQRIVIK